MLRLGEFDTNTLKVTAVRLGAGCVEACAQCGAYEQADHPGDYIAKEVDPARIAACILQEVDEVVDDESPLPVRPDEAVSAPAGPENWEFVMHDDGNWHFETDDGVVLDASTIRPVIDTRNRLIHYFDTVVTSDVNQEPLNGEAFLHFYRLVRLLSGGNSRVPLITHGIRANAAGKIIHPKAEERLKKIVEAMDSKDIIVLSLDRARSDGSISKNVNLVSYAETLNRLKPALDKGMRVTVSLQGNEDSQSRLYRVRVDKLWTDLKIMLVTDYGWTQQDLGKIHTDTGRNWAWRGRAENMIGVRPENQAPVLPDSYYVSRHMSSLHAKMGFVDAVSGKTYIHAANIGRGYNDVSTISRWLSRAKLDFPMNGWEEVTVNDAQLPDLSAEFTREARLASFKALRLRRLASYAGVPAPVGPLAGPQQQVDSGPGDGGGGDGEDGHIGAGTGVIAGDEDDGVDST